MPTYQYQCTECKHEFEEFQKITDDPLQFCPECDGKIKRIISGGAGLLFKGSGFYITDYRSDGYKKDAARDSSAPANVSEKGSTGSSDKSKKTDSGAASSPSKKDS
jgi:putative FmdB family regulatory protein